MPNKLPNRSWVVVLLIVIAPACFEQGSYRVGMKRVTSELVYGVPPLSVVAAPPGAIPSIPATVEAPPPFESSFRPPTSAPPPAVEQCPEAGPNDFPQEPAPTTVTTQPKEGLYVWKMKGTQRVPPFPFPIGLPQFADRSVEGVQDDEITPGTNFTFMTKERDPSLNSRTVITQTFRVDQTNPSTTLRGVLLTRIEKDKQDGNPAEVFEPQPPILYLPLPIQIGPASEWNSTGVDPTNPLAIQTLTHHGFVKERKRIDACGDVVDSWLVEAEQVVGAGSSSTSKKYDYSIAPHFGGLIVFEHVESPCTTITADRKCTPEADLVYDTNLGQIEPDHPAGSQ